MAPVTHIVIFEYKSGTSIPQKENISKAFLALCQKCLSPSNTPGFDCPGKPYIQSIIAGSNNSSEDPAEGYEHAFIVTFESPAHRNYYVGLDPAHIDFKNLVGPLIRKNRTVVTDFVNGVWNNNGPKHE